MGTYIPVELRQLVYERACGRCEYCLIPEIVVFVPHEIDRILRVISFHSIILAGIVGQIIST